MTSAPAGPGGAAAGAGPGGAGSSAPPREQNSGVPGAPAEPADAAAYLDLLLADASLGMLRRFLPGRSMARFGLGLARSPGTVARRVAGLAGDLGSIAAGRSALAPPARDRRFADPAWTANPVLRRLVQA